MYKSIIVWLAEPVFPEDISQAVPLMYFFYLDSIILMKSTNSDEERGAHWYRNTMFNGIWQNLHYLSQNNPVQAS